MSRRSTTKKNSNSQKKSRSKTPKSSKKSKRTENDNKNIVTSSNVRPSQIKNSRNRSKTVQKRKQSSKPLKSKSKTKKKKLKAKSKPKTKTNPKAKVISKKNSKKKNLKKIKTKKSNNDTRTRSNTVKPKNTENDSKYPWYNWQSSPQETQESDEYKYDNNISRNNKKNNRTNSMSSVSQFFYENKKRDKEEKRIKRKENNNQMYSNYRQQEKQEYYKKHNKTKKGHHVKRSSLPTYNSLRNNSMLLKKHLQKEKSRNLATLMLDPSKRMKSKTYKNLTGGGFEVHINKRYQLDDGRIGFCRFKGRTMFGKSSEDWIGIIVEVGDGEHNGTVQGKSYFKCREGTGVMVRPSKIMLYLGSNTKLLTKKEIKAAKKAIKKYKKRGGSMQTLPNTDENEYVEDHADDMLKEKTYHPMSVLNRNKGKRVKKKARYYEV